MTAVVTIGNARVRVEGEHVQDVLGSKLFAQWCARLDERFVLRHMRIQSVDFVYRKGNKEILFIKFVATYMRENEEITCIVHLRGGAVVLFVILVCDEKEYVVTVSEERLPAGVYHSVGLPAGMLDGSNDAAGIAVKELQEETGISLDPTQFVEMSQAYYGSHMHGVDVSRGGSDEYYKCFFARVAITDKELAALHGRRMGVIDEREQIVVGVVPVDQLLHISPQASTFIAYTLYKALDL